MKRTSSQRWLSSLRANSLAVLLGIALSMLALELLLRFWNPFPFRVRSDQIALPANIVYSFQEPETLGGRLVIHRKNSLGFRGEEPPDDLGSRLSIVTVGGSTTECFYLAEGQTWPDQVSDVLRRHVDRLWLNNAGLDGHSTFGHYILLRDYVLKLKPKIVLLLVGINDIGIDRSRPSDWRNLVSGHSAFNMRALAYAVVNQSEALSLMLNLYRVWKARNMQVAHRFPSLEERRRRPVVEPDAEVRVELDRHREVFVPTYTERLESLVDLVGGAGAIPVLLTQPTLSAPMPGEPLSREWRILDLYNAATRAVGDRRDVPLIDLANRMPPDPALFYDAFHFTAEGSEAVARIVAGPLCAMLQRQWPAMSLLPCPDHANSR